jgi:hypothetical protein
MCGSFLTIRENHVYLIHQSVKCYLVGEGSSAIFTSGFAAAHPTIFSRFLRAMTGTLRCDMYGLRHPGFPIERAKAPNADPLAPVRYACIYWVDHLKDTLSSNHLSTDEFRDGSGIHIFLPSKYLYWLEALGLLRSTSERITSMLNLEGLIQVSFHLCVLGAIVTLL